MLNFTLLYFSCIMVNESEIDVCLFDFLSKPATVPRPIGNLFPQSTRSSFLGITVV